MTTEAKRPQLAAGKRRHAAQDDEGGWDVDPAQCLQKPPSSLPSFWQREPPIPHESYKAHSFKSQPKNKKAYLLPRTIAAMRNTPPDFSMHSWSGFQKGKATVVVLPSCHCCSSKAVARTQRRKNGKMEDSSYCKHALFHASGQNAIVCSIPSEKRFFLLFVSLLPPPSRFCLCYMRVASCLKQRMNKYYAFLRQTLPLPTFFGPRPSLYFALAASPNNCQAPFAIPFFSRTAASKVH
ncbi:hypothetical protein BX070DRAFT_85175 [Coemansia spiralis]|nr:hypothetical protein BX070DRAFT_85175 [Coemansia spiralis]